MQPCSLKYLRAVNNLFQIKVIIVVPIGVDATSTVFLLSSPGVSQFISRLQNYSEEVPGIIIEQGHYSAACVDR